MTGRHLSMGGWDAVAMVSGEMGGTDDAMEQGMNVGILVAASSRLAAYCRASAC